MTRRKRNSAVKRRRLRKRTRTSEEERDIVVLFADVVGCSEISNHSSLKQYNDFIKTFQECFKGVCEFYKKEVYQRHEYPLFQYQPRGDEGCLKVFVSRKGDLLARDIDMAIGVALDLKTKWLFTQYNRDRIMKEGLLPADLAIGIHSGQVYVKEGQPEGYAINLAKRIESASRNGKFTHILLSESAHGELYYLKDECMYKFDRPFTIKPKGISHAIEVFEIKHHFLATDWMDYVSDNPEEISMVYPELGVSDILEVAKTAYEINPTNLWLAEEYLFLTMMDIERRLRAQKREENLNALESEYEPALKIAQRIANTDLRDATLLSIWGQVLGEMRRYDEEEKKYREAIKLDEADGDLHWYLALCISYQLCDAQGDKTKVEEFYKGRRNRKRIQEVLKEYGMALDLEPVNPWIPYDYACELAWWSQVEKSFKRMAIKMLRDALKLYPELKEWAKEEAYLKPIIDDPQIKNYLK